MTKRENFIKTARFEHPDYIPMTFCINSACWAHYPQEQLLDLMEAHPFLFPDFKRPETPFVPYFAPVARKGQPYRDDWGCVWETSENGITGTVTEHPLQSWDAWDSYPIPDPSKVMGIGPIDWEKEKQSITKAHEEGKLTQAGLRHGHTFLQLCDIRGYENLLFDMNDGEPRLQELIQRVEDFNLEIVRRYCQFPLDVFCYPEDLGMQRGPMLSPYDFRTYIKPSYTKLMKPAKEKGTLIHMHSDGDLHDLIDDMMETEIDIFNLQDLVNGIEWIRERFYQKLCVELDVDRQSVTVYGSPKEVDALIRQEVERLGSPQGGLMMIYGLYPGTPIENAKAVMDAMETYAFYYT